MIYIGIAILQLCEDQKVEIWSEGKGLKRLAVPLSSIYRGTYWPQFDQTRPHRRLVALLYEQPILDLRYLALS